MIQRYLEGRNKLCLRLSKDGYLEVGIEHERVDGAAVIMNVICRDVKFLAHVARVLANPTIVLCSRVSSRWSCSTPSVQQYYTHIMVSPSFKNGGDRGVNVKQHSIE